MAQPIVVAGWGQTTQPKNATPPYLDPIEMMVGAAADAARVGGDGIVQHIDTVLVVRTQSRNLESPGETIARRLGIKPHTIRVSGIGGEVPQHFVNQAAGMLARGESTGVLICGAETYYPRSDDDVTGEAALIQGIPDDYDADDAVGSNNYEQLHGLTLPIHGFPLFENALWAASGLNKQDWLQRVGGLWSRFSEVAAAHPNAWTRAPANVERIITPQADNRPICFPYTKRMVSLVMADLGAAVILTTADRAASCRNGGGRAVYFRGGAYAKDKQRFMVDKADFTRSQALETIKSRVEQRANLAVADLDGFDLYSCFPCAVNVARGHLGIADDDPRPLTQTGGLGFFGGPGSNYALHGIATLAENIANGKLNNGMSTALGWFMHKYAAGIYSDQAGDPIDAADDVHDLQNPETGDGPVPCTTRAEGNGTLETYTVIYRRDQTPERGLLYGKTESGERFVANCEQDDKTFQALTDENRIGNRVELSHDTNTGINLARLAE